MSTLRAAMFLRTKGQLLRSWACVSMTSREWQPITADDDDDDDDGDDDDDEDDDDEEDEEEEESTTCVIEVSASTPAPNLARPCS